MTRNGRKMVIFKVTIRLGESDFTSLFKLKLADLTSSFWDQRQGTLVQFSKIEKVTQL